MNTESTEFNKFKGNIQKSIKKDYSIQKDIKYLLGTQTLIKIRDQLLNIELDNSMSKYEDKILAACDRKLSIMSISSKQKEKNRRFKNAVRKVLIVLRMAYSSISQSKLGKIDISDAENSGEILFDKNYFCRPKEPPFPNEAKQMLLLPPEKRSEEMIRFVTICLSFSVPEFLEYPVHMQKRIALYSYYQEFGPSRVIIRQGHPAHNYYMIISGTALVISTKMDSDKTEYIYRPIAHLKRGDCFGDLALIKNIHRNATITVFGNHSLSLLVVDKEDFFKIQTPLTTDAERYLFLKNRVNILEISNYPVEILNKLERTKLLSIYYKNGMK